MNPYPQRRARVRARLAGAGLDALLVTRLVNVRYLTGFTGSAGSLVVRADAGAAMLATDGRYGEQARTQTDVEVLVNPPAGWPARVLARGARLGVESDALSWDGARALIRVLDGIVVVPAPGHVEALRQVKDDVEIDTIARAAAIADAAFGDLLGWLRAGVTEREVAVRLERAMVDRGAASAAFGTIVAAGPNGALPHHRPSQRALRAGDLVVLDFGALVDGYHSDMTRMVALGAVEARLEAVYALVRAAQQAGVDAVHAGVDTTAVDAACRDVIAGAGYADAFTHPTGHGVGLEIHEDPYLRAAQGPAGQGARLSPGTVITVEPGVYLPGLGGVRIEDLLVVTPDGPQLLTSTPKDLARI